MTGCAISPGNNKLKYGRDLNFVICECYKHLGYRKFSGDLYEPSTKFLGGLIGKLSILSLFHSGISDLPFKADCWVVLNIPETIVPAQKAIRKQSISKPRAVPPYHIEHTSSTCRLFVFLELTTHSLTSFTKSSTTFRDVLSELKLHKALTSALYEGSAVLCQWYPRDPNVPSCKSRKDNRCNIISNKTLFIELRMTARWSWLYFLRLILSWLVAFSL